MAHHELNCRDLSTEINCTHSSIWRFVSGGKNPSAPLIDKLTAWLEG